MPNLVISEPHHKLLAQIAKEEGHKLGRIGAKALDAYFENRNRLLSLTTTYGQIDDNTLAVTITISAAGRIDEKFQIISDTTTVKKTLTELLNLMKEFCSQKLPTATKEASHDFKL